MCGTYFFSPLPPPELLHSPQKKKKKIGTHGQVQIFKLFNSDSRQSGLISKEFYIPCGSGRGVGTLKGSSDANNASGTVNVAWQKHPGLF